MPTACWPSASRTARGTSLRDHGDSVLVLLAERDPFAADLAEYLLRTEGFEVILALDAAESERLYAERTPAIVVVDLMISGGRGVALCKKLSEQGASRHRRVVGAAAGTRDRGRRRRVPEEAA